MEEIIIIPAIFLGLPWIIMHYITKWKTAATITTPSISRSVNCCTSVASSRRVRPIRSHNSSKAAV